MDINLPARLRGERITLTNTNVLVILGANGAGKSSFGRELINAYPKQAKRIAGLPALYLEPLMKRSMPSNTISRVEELLETRFRTPRMTEYEKLLLALQHEEFEAAVNFKEEIKKGNHPPVPITRIDTIQRIWEKTFPNNRIVRTLGFFEIVSTGRDSPSYTAARMSDGEKIVIYLIGAILAAKPNAFLVIEEPEIFLHNSIKKSLWDDIERLRPDCTFCYLTHDIEFAESRPETTKFIWIRSYNADDRVWDYDPIENGGRFPEGVYMEILGSRRPILFIEGTANQSIDYKLYPLIFKDYLVKPMGGCQQVIEATKAFSELNEFHHLSSWGIVDRDRRTENEVRRLNRQRVYVPNVAEVENLFLLEPVIKTVAKYLKKEPDEVFEKTKGNIIAHFKRDLREQVILHSKHKVRKKLEFAVNYKIHSVKELARRVNNVQTEILPFEIYQSFKQAFYVYAKENDYNSILRVYNYKPMLSESGLCEYCNLTSPKVYIRLVLRILREKGEASDTIRKAIQNSLGWKDPKE